ncbi:hypothetical protein PTE30175_00456 [Pandoraea terrae]|uniref:SnoaL-like domain-containing protein n=1 Tax=Pandoraea terrae TaxID=1537710 RepID=A0A5E4S023_9BURK|nr:nuclear transport factor 2 family protein [Pandoraea terrae]VVD68705.1 hypothetical protein PTE30175_00456 [Pandoraea terrae]
MLEFDAADRDRACGEVYLIAYHLKQEQGSGEVGSETRVVTGGRYLDEYTRLGGVWRFAHREVVMDWNEVGPSLRRWPLTSGFGADDPSWRLFGAGNREGA